ncbi:MAG TPA: alpha/beta hydrolase [Gemmatimonadota bacterium]|nr:alpha/beta hydrolase [Gemmatimonadota bacterium]
MILTVPGWTGSGPDHWQSLWERERSGVRRVEMPDWDRPRREEWTAALVTALADAAGPAIIAAHSLGCLAIAHWAGADPRGAGGWPARFS